MASLSAFITLVCVIGIYVQQQGKTQQQTPQLADPASPSGLVLETQATGTSLTAVGRVDGLPEPCTAWLLDVGAPADAQAVAVTTGRCVGITDSSQVTHDLDVADATMDFDAFAPVTTAAPPTPVTAAMDRILWASSRWTDLALFGWSRPTASWRRRCVADHASGDAGAGHGHPRGRGAGRRGALGPALRPRRPAAPSGPPWTWSRGPGCSRTLMPTDCTGVLGGSTGSPVFNPAGAGRGDDHSSTIAGKDPQACGVGEPCEVGAGEVTSAPNTTYVLPVAGLASCWDDGGLTLGGQCPWRIRVAWPSHRSRSRRRRRVRRWPSSWTGTTGRRGSPTSRGTSARWTAPATRAGPIPWRPTTGSST